MVKVCTTDRLYHYLFNGEESIDAILAEGLLPLSALSNQPRWLSLNQRFPDLFKSLYTLFAEPILKEPYRNSGIFLTPIDFRKMPDQPLSGFRRIVVPTTALDATMTTITYEWMAKRVVMAFSQTSLEQVRDLWTDDLVRSWFGRDRYRLFFSVPQVVSYQGNVPIQHSWVE